MNAHLDKFFTFASFAACLLILAVGVRSYRVGDVLIIAQNTFGAQELKCRELGLSTGQGRMLFAFSQARFSLYDPRDDAHFHANYAPGTHLKHDVQLPQDMLDIDWDQTVWRRHGFVASRLRAGIGSVTSQIRLGAPFWFLALPFAVAPGVAAVRRWRRRQRRNRGLCPVCGYDLRASSDRCPECGWSPTGATRPHVITRIASAAALVALVLCATAIALSRTPARLLPSQADLLPSTRPGYKPDTRPTGGPSPAIAEFKGLPPYHPGHPIPQAVREMAMQIDTSRTYFFVDMYSGLHPKEPKRTSICVRLYARPGGRWHSLIQYIRPGDVVGDGHFPTGLKLGEIRTTSDDVLVTFINPADGTTETRSGKADAHDPVRKFLTGMVGNFGVEWEAVLFPS